MIFFIQNALIQMCDTPSQRNIILEQIYQHFGSFSCIAVSPCLEWCKKLSFFVKCHISVHHSTESDRSQFLDRYSVFFLYIFCHIAVAVLKTCPDIVQRVCPQSVLITVLPCMASGCDRIVLLIDQYCFNSCRTEFDSKICFSAFNDLFYIAHCTLPPKHYILSFLNISIILFLQGNIYFDIPCKYNLLPVILYLIICGMQRCSTGVHS